MKILNNCLITLQANFKPKDKSNIVIFRKSMVKLTVLDISINEENLVLNRYIFSHMTTKCLYKMY